ncbi:MAG: VCBS repeat-containing protein [Sphingobacteriaceae bacterium]|nr:VCBS repeat-containing protein [Cytophagaceae bacterium]
MAPCGVYRNDARQKNNNHFLKVAFQGAPGNRFAVGATVRVWAAQQQQVLQQIPARGFQSCVEPVLLFGLGKTTRLDSLDVVWPGGRRQRLTHLPVDRTLTLDWRQSSLPPAPRPPLSAPGPLLTDVTAQTFTTPVRHQENRFVDFNRERLMPHLLSTQGPKLALGDLNGDGRDDVFVGGARGQASRVFTQRSNGSFALSPQPDFEEDKDFEDAEAAIFDADGDGDNDLVVASGGNETQQLGIVRVYVNGGGGHLKANPARSPAVLVNASCLRPADYDGDGDLDLFVGGRSVPGHYGLQPRSYLLRNDGGTFADATPEALSRVGMVTSAAWADFDRDGQPDLLLIGEWMPLTLFKNEKGRFIQNSEFKIQNSEGWWNCLAVGDLDGDGDPDIVTGNWGTNTKFSASTERPMELTVSDIDGNETTEAFISYYRSDGKSYPYHVKGDVVGQVPTLKKRFLHYADYARQPVSALLTDEQAKTAYRARVACLESSVFWNERGVFKRQALPDEAQAAPVMALCLRDLTGDGRPDLVLGGNVYGVKPEIGRHDASYGLVLRNEGRRFAPVPFQESGLLMRGEVRDLQVVRTSKGVHLLVARNDDTLLSFKVSK